jgi:hypothetical protein
MKYLLTSAGIKNISIHNALVDLLGKPIAESSALCIPTATYAIRHPYLAGATRQQLRSRVDWMLALRPPLRHGLIRRQDTVHRAPGAELAAFVEQDCIDRAWRAVDKPLTVKHLAHRLPLTRTERSRVRRARLRRCR